MNGIFFQVDPDCALLRDFETKLTEDEVTSLVEDKRAYNVLDYLQTKPNVIYQVKIKNTNEA